MYCQYTQEPNVQYVKVAFIPLNVRIVGRYPREERADSMSIAANDANQDAPAVHFIGVARVLANEGSTRIAL